MFHPILALAGNIDKQVVDIVADIVGWKWAHVMLPALWLDLWLNQVYLVDCDFKKKEFFIYNKVFYA